MRTKKLQLATWTNGTQVIGVVSHNKECAWAFQWWNDPREAPTYNRPSCLYNGIIYGSRAHKQAGAGCPRIQGLNTKIPFVPRLYQTRNPAGSKVKKIHQARGKREGATKGAIGCLILLQKGKKRKGNLETEPGHFLGWGCCGSRKKEDGEWN
jgi:hypothetical protein